MREYSLKQKFSSLKSNGAFHYYMASYVEKLFDYGSQFILAFFLLPEDLGKIKYALTINEVLIAIATLGLPMTLLSLLANKDKEVLKTYISNSFFMIIVASFITITVTILLYNSGTVINDKNLVSFISLLAPITLFWSLSRLLQATLQANKKFKDIAYSQVLSKIIGFPILFYLIYSLSTYGYILGMYIGSIVTFIIVFFFSQRNSKISILSVNIHTQLKLISESKFAFYAQIISIIGIYINYLIVTFTDVDNIEFGYYSFSLIIIQGLQLFITTTQNYIIPFFTNSKLTNTDIRYKTNQIERYVLFIILFIIPISILVSKFGLFLIFKEYQPGENYLYLLLVVWGIKVLPTIKGAVFISRGKLKQNFKNSILSLMITIPISSILIINYGIYGAIFAGFIQAVINYVIINRSFNKIFKI